MKSLKKFLCLCLSIIICFSLCSCNFIDELREKQAHFNKNNNIVYNGKVYKVLNDCKYSPSDFSKNKTVIITEEDVPLLLSETLGERFYLSDDEKFIKKYSFGYDYDYSYEDETLENNVYYAREDVYDEISSMIETSDYFDHYAFIYTDSVKDEKHNYEVSVEKWKLVDNDAKDVFDFELDYGMHYKFEYEYMSQYYVTDIYKVSNDLTFKKLHLSLYNPPAGLYVVRSDYTSGIEIYIPVPIQYQDTIMKIVNEFNKLDKSEKIPIDDFVDGDITYENENLF